MEKDQRKARKRYMIKTYSKAKDGAKKVAEHFSVREFACNDGSDKILIDSKLIELLEKIRQHTGKQVTITSAYRTGTYNKKVGGATNSQHTKGTAADIVVAGVDPMEIAQIAEYYLGATGGIGYYKYGRFTHVDVRTKMSRWKETAGRTTVTCQRFDTKGIKEEEKEEKTMPKVIAVKRNYKTNFNGKKAEVEACNIDGASYIKTRDLEKLGIKVEFNEKTEEIILTSK